MQKQSQKLVMNEYISRRGFLSDVAAGILGVALLDLDNAEAAENNSAINELTKQPWEPGGPQFQPRARQVLHIFCPGAASHI
ncbi:MAG: twin-arginine translocation signal domain-containing protein, partial [bacterium]